MVKRTKKGTIRKHNIINGKIIVDRGQLVTMDMPKLLENHHAMTADLMHKAQWT